MIRYFLIYKNSILRYQKIGAWKNVSFQKANILESQTITFRVTSQEYGEYSNDAESLCTREDVKRSKFIMGLDLVEFSESLIGQNEIEVVYRFRDHHFA
jgi:hypothetical protein